MDNVDDEAANHYAQLRVWDLETWEEPFRRPDGPWVDSMAWSPDSEHLALSLSEPDGEKNTIGVVRVLDRTGHEVSTFRDKDNLVQILSLAFTPDGEQLIGARSPMPRLSAVLRHHRDLGLANGSGRADDRNGRLPGGAEPRR